MKQKSYNPKLYLTLGLIFLFFRFIGDFFCFLGFIGFYGILLLFFISFYNLMINIKEKEILKRSGICFFITVLMLSISFYISSSTFIIFKNVGKEKIEIIEYTYEGRFIGTDIFSPIKPTKSVFKIKSLEPNGVKLVRINKYKYTEGALWIINQDTISQIVDFKCFKMCHACIIRKNLSTDIDFYNSN